MTRDHDIADTRLPQSLGVGEPMVAGGIHGTVTRIRSHPANGHNGPIRSDWHAVEVTTTTGTRWFGSETPPYIGSDLRMHWGPSAQ